MPRCGCSGSCSCVVVGGAGMAVTGSGSAVDPTIIAADCTGTVACVGSRLGAGLAYDAAGGVLAAKRSADADNTVVFGSDGGLKVPAVAAGGVLTANSGTVTFSGTGLAGSPIVATVPAAVLAGFPRGRIGLDTFTFTVNTNNIGYYKMTDRFTFPGGRRIRIGAHATFYAAAATLFQAHFYVDTGAGIANTCWWCRPAPAGSLSDGVHEELVMDPLAGVRQVWMAARTMTAGVNVQVSGQVWAIDEGAVGFFGPAGSGQAPNPNLLVLQDSLPSGAPR